MTIEIRELVIQARVTAAEEKAPSSTPRNRAQEKAEEARWVEMITQRVLERLREERGWNQ